jgi:hypothetical protein
MYVVSFHAIFNENANILAHRLGVPFIQNMNVKDNDIIIVFGAHECADQLLDLQNKMNIEYIIIQTEQYNSKAFDNKYYCELLARNSALDWSKENIRRLKKQVTTPFYSVYYYDCFVSESIPEFNSRPIDFFFCGSKSAERELILNDFKIKNLDYNIEFDLSYSYTNPLELNEKLKQVKYVINLPFYRENSLETQRINKALSMGCSVVSLPSSDRDMNDQYKDFVYFVPRLTDFSLLIEQPPKKPYIKLIEQFGAYQIQSNIEGIKYAEKKLNEKLEQKKLTQNVLDDPPIQVLL